MQSNLTQEQYTTLLEHLGNAWQVLEEAGWDNYNENNIAALLWELFAVIPDPDQTPEDDEEENL